jgi:hypothetical protein
VATTVSRRAVTPHPKKKTTSTAVEKVKRAKEPVEVVVAPLSAEELRDLQRHEKLIAKTVGALWDLGKALADIRDRKLYRVGYKTFEAYCSTRWDFSAGRARQIIGATDQVAIIESAPTAVAVLPTKERQMRPLARLVDPVQKVEAWVAAVDAAGGDQPTEEQVAAAAEKVLPPPATTQKLSRTHLDGTDSLPRTPNISPSTEANAILVAKYVAQLRSELTPAEQAAVLTEMPWSMLMLAACEAFRMDEQPDGNLAKRITENQWAKAINRQIVVGAYVAPRMD